MKGYKAFEKGMVCREKQYAENTVFEEDSAEICKSGMHFCKEPLDVLDYYPLVDDEGNISEFAEVEALDECLTDDNKKFCTKKLKIGSKISFSELIQKSVKFQKHDCARISSSEDYAQIGSSGHRAQISSSGNRAQISSSGKSAQIGISGDGARISSSGHYAQIGSSGKSAQIGISGDGARISSSGDYAQIGSSGHYARIGSSGDCAQIGISGDCARISSDGSYAVICCAGHNSIAKAKIGSWITLSEWEYDENKGGFIPLCVKTEYVDGVRIKEDTFYKLVNGEFKEWQE